MKENTNKLLEVFTAVLEIDKDMVNDELKYQSIPQWDSINHMFLISEIETAFGVEIDPDDILEINSFPGTKQVLAKYGVKF